MNVNMWNHRATRANLELLQARGVTIVPPDSGYLACGMTGSGLVESILAGKRLNENQWSVDGPSGCLVPAGKPGPFRTSVRWNAAVDRLSGTSERHATACIEFREGCGLWTAAGFHDEAARDEWQEPVKAAFRLLADTGFGGERSRGWGRAETPEFVEGTLPGLIIEYKRKEA